MVIMSIYFVIVMLVYICCDIYVSICISLYVYWYIYVAICNKFLELVKRLFRN